MARVFIEQLEKRIAGKAASALIGAGYSVTINDGEEDVVTESTNVDDILERMFSTDEDIMIAVKDGKGVGWVRFIYGNDGWDVINDYTTNLNEILAPVNAYADTYA